MWIETPGINAGTGVGTNRARKSSPAPSRSVGTSHGRRKSEPIRPARSTKRAATYARPKRPPVSTGVGRLTVPTIAPWKMILAAILVGLFGIVYIGHLLATQKLLEEVQTLQHEYNRTHRVYNEVQLEYGRMTGPKEIYQRARGAGFVNAGPADRTLTLNP